VLVGEKIETLPQFDFATEQGFAYFQGFFFGHPLPRGGNRIEGLPAGYFRILSALQDPELTVLQLEDLVKHDTAICYRILRAANSAACAQHGAVDSVRQALVLLGLDTVRRWASLWILAGLGSGGNTELVVMSVIRARCCELMGDASRQAYVPAAFLLGMCSLLDAILGCPMGTILEHLDLPAETQAALLGQDGHSRRVLDCVVAAERGEWDRSLELAVGLGVDPCVLALAHREALAWAGDLRRAS
jgi:EAL and modified HD-GYP domain-containing signal transduction protein